MMSLLRLRKIVSVISAIILCTDAATSFDYLLAPGKIADRDFTCGGPDVGLKAQYNLDQHLALTVQTCQILQAGVQQTGAAEKVWDFYAADDGSKVVGHYSVASSQGGNCPTPRIMAVSDCSRVSISLSLRNLNLC